MVLKTVYKQQFVSPSANYSINSTNQCDNSCSLVYPPIDYTLNIEIDRINDMNDLIKKAGLESESSILIYLSQRGNKGIHKDMLKIVYKHEEDLEVFINNLVNKGFIEVDDNSNNELYIITPKGRKEVDRILYNIYINR